MSRNRSALWQFFSICEVDKKFVVCKFCNAKISRGSEDPKKQTTSGMKTHMSSKHPVEYKEPMDLTQATSSQGQLNPKCTPEVSRNETSIFNIRSKRQRIDLFETTIPDWVESKTVWDFNSEKAKKLHKSVFEMIVLDLMPWSTVNKPGFLRNQKLSTPNLNWHPRSTTVICLIQVIVR